MKLILENNIDDTVSRLKDAFYLSDYDINLLVLDYIRYGLKSSRFFAIMKYHGHIEDERYIHPDNEFVRALRSSLAKIEDTLLRHGIVGSYWKHVVDVNITRQLITLELR